jgi:pimeloyl-ACP methyl ester carboxylesterase
MAPRSSTYQDHRIAWPNRLPPARAGDLAYLRFCTPKLSARRSADHDILVARARFHLRNAAWVRVPTAEGAMQAFVFEPDEPGATKGSILVAHGWTSESSFMAVFAEQLRRAGFRIVLFDQPAHGQSARERASLIDCSRALLQVAEALGPVRFVIAHSMGCLAALLAGEGGAPMPRAYPFERGANLLAATGRPALLIHSRDDQEVLFECAEEIAAAWPRAELMAFDGLGHRNILFAPPVIRAAVAYLTRP